MLQQRRVGLQYRCDGCEALFFDLHMHELISRSLTTHNEEARLVSFEPELCAMLCPDCHALAHTSHEERDRLFQKNYRRYGYQAVAARYEQLVRHVQVFELPENEMDFNEYQKSARKTAVYPGANQHFGTIFGLNYTILGLTNEAGELAGVLKKFYRDSGEDELVAQESFGDVMDSYPEWADKLASELGDVLWYLAMVASEMNLDLSKVAQQNIEKLQRRQQNNTLHGSGDNR